MLMLFLFALQSYFTSYLFLLYMLLKLDCKKNYLVLIELNLIFKNGCWLYFRAYGFYFKLYLLVFYLVLGNQLIRQYNSSSSTCYRKHLTHNLLLQRLKIIGLSEMALKLFKNYWSKRTLCVTGDNYSSTLGSIFSSYFIFNLYQWHWARNSYGQQNEWIPGTVFYSFLHIL